MTVSGEQRAEAVREVKLVSSTELGPLIRRDANLILYRPVEDIVKRLSG